MTKNKYEKGEIVRVVNNDFPLGSREEIERLNGKIGEIVRIKNNGQRVVEFNDEDSQYFFYPYEIKIVNEKGW